MKIIHIVENLDKGAVENWLVRSFIESRKVHPDWQWTFYCIFGKKGRLDDVVLEAGGNIIYSPMTISKKIPFLRHLRKTLKTGGYDIIHAHHDFLSGFYLIATIGIRFKRKLLHIHNNDKVIPVGSSFLRKILLNPFRRIALAMSDIVVGISQNTVSEFVLKKSDDQKVLYYGVDLSAFRIKVDPLVLKNELNVPDKAKLILFTGRMNQVKNPCFVVDILAEVLKKHKDVYAIFIGKGDLEAEVLEKAQRLGVSNNIRMLGWRNDVALIMRSCDVFVFPRIEHSMEGLGLVVVEAQAAGLPMILSKGIPEDAIVVEELAHFLPLDVSMWAEKLFSITNNPQRVQQKDAIDKMMRSDFELKRATENLLSLYN